ncbi:uncharacterized protein SCHCODRAFT_02368171 [Schizophyllum commune H4-8]|uniref:uncharacterized protein n=1 Tax=Schizophyllum commune (strain H4-8 / FGSC 9210) TaxID=578458 RepID=UPI00215E076D|nr:uncharacterized protein SCHCODRAFT_02368171 [Schizophyllum commune H4-8]KAI5889455.1 hypothetical protein SCHCODRAFT_02368171 [Schizophyllum commune H4-8]
MAEDKPIRIFFISFAIETLLLGLFLSTAFLSLYFMVQRRKRNASLDKWVFGGVCALIASVTAHWAVGFARLFGAFFSPGITDADYYITDFYEPTYVTKSALLYLTLSVAATLLIYRLHMIWRDQVMVLFLPIVLLLVSAAAEVFEIYLHFDSERPTDSIYKPPFSKWIFAIFAMDMS